MITKFSVWRQTRAATAFETMQLALIGVFVLLGIAKFIHPLATSILVTHYAWCLWTCQTYFFFDALFNLIYHFSIAAKMESDAKGAQHLAAVGFFVIDLTLIFLSFVRFLRALRPLLVLRRIGSATEHSTRSPEAVRKRWLGGYAKVLERTLERAKFAFILLYSFTLIVFSTAGLIFESEIQMGRGINITTYADSVWYCIGQVTLTGSQYGPETFAGRAYSVLLLFVGLGIVGLFTKGLEPFFRSIFTSRKAEREVLSS